MVQRFQCLKYVVCWQSIAVVKQIGILSALNRCSLRNDARLPYQLRSSNHNDWQGKEPPQSCVRNYGSTTYQLNSRQQFIDPTMKNHSHGFQVVAIAQLKQCGALFTHLRSLFFVLAWLRYRCWSRCRTMQNMEILAICHVSLLRSG